MGYKVSDIKIYKEDSFNVAPTTPKVYKMKNTSNDLNEEQRSENKKFLGNGHEPSHATYGGYDYSGSLGVVYGADYMAILCEGVIGAGDSTDATTEARASSTAYDVGDIVNHTDGTHSLVCYKAGTSASGTLTITSVNEFDLVVDGTVTWVVRTKLKKVTGKLDACSSSFGIEKTEIASCGVADDIIERFTGVIFDSMTLKKEGGEITFENSQSVKALGYDNSLKNTSYSALSAGTVLNENYFSEDDLTVEVSIDGTTWTALNILDSINLTITKASTIKDTMTGKRPSFSSVEIAGNAIGLYGSTLYDMSKDKVERQVRFTYAKSNGDKAIIKFSSIKFGNSKKTNSTDEDSTLDITLSGAGSIANSAVSYEIITTVVL